MRQVISISLPEDTVTYIKTKMKQAGITSQSEYFRHLIDLEASLISEQDILRYAKQAKQAHNSGNTIKLTSLADLM